MVLKHFMEREERRRRRALLAPSRRWRLGTTGRLALAALALIALAFAVLGRHGPGRAQQAVLSYARSGHRPALDLVLAGARAHRIVVLGGEPDAPAARRFAAEVVQTMAKGPGLDVLAVPVSADAQPALDRFVNAPREDAGILLADPAALGASTGGNGLLDLYRAVRRLNDELGADRRIRILAADLPAWAAGRPLSPHAAVQLYAERDAFMTNRIEADVFEREPTARILVFGDGLHALRGWATAATGGGRPLPFNWLAAHLEKRHPGDVFSVLTDAPEAAGAAPRVARYRGTRLYPVLRDGGGLPASFGLSIDAHLDALEQPIRVATAAGVELTLQPPDAHLSQMADVYVFLGGR